jgi:hypothetical protein
MANIAVPFSLETLNYSIGKSESGYHYAINEFSTMAPDREGHWSEPFATLEAAEDEARDVISSEVKLSKSIHAMDEEMAARYENEPAIIKDGSWLMSDDGRTETRLSIGQSDRGYHYLLEVGDSDDDLSWSSAFKTQELAERVGEAAEARVRGDTYMLLDGRRRDVARAVGSREMPPQEVAAYRLLDAHKYAAWNNRPDVARREIDIAEKFRHQAEREGRGFSVMDRKAQQPLQDEQPDVSRDESVWAQEAERGMASAPEQQKSQSSGMRLKA